MKKILLTLIALSFCGMSMSQAQTFECHEQAGKFGTSPDVAGIVHLTADLLVYTSLQAGIPTLAYSFENSSVQTTRTGQWRIFKNFGIEESSGARLRAYYRVSDDPFRMLALECTLAR